MSIITHKLWPDISGSSTKLFRGCYGDYTYKKSSFSGLGTKDFSFSKYIESNSHGCRGYGDYYGNYGNYGNYGYSNYCSSYGLGGYSGFGAFGCTPKWFNSFMETTTAIMAGLSVGKAFAGLFVKDKVPADVAGDTGDKVYRNKTVITVTEEKDDDGNVSYKVTKTTSKVESTDGKTGDIVEIKNPTNAILNNKYEVVFDTQVVYARGRDGKITKTTQQVLSANDTVETLDAKYEDGLEEADVVNLFASKDDGSAEA